MKTLVLGLGKSGKAAFDLLKEEGDEVVGFDDRHLDSYPMVEEFDRIVVSPGVPPSHPIYAKAVELGKEVIGEAELALSRIQQPCIGITGTNGKTTVTLLTEHVLNSWGKKAKALGNIGTPLTSYLKESDCCEIMVVELSSFQLETMKSRVFDLGIILNITPNHLNRHASMTEYATVKCHLQKLIKPSGSFWVHESVAANFGGLLKDGYQTYREDGNHDAENAKAAWILCQPFGVDEKSFYEALKTFKKPPHRIEFVAEVGGVKYVNDSKSSNVEATMAAVKSMKGDVILIAGGVDKGSSYAPWKKVFKGKVKKVVVLGEAAEKIAEELKSEFEIERVSSLEEAVAVDAKPGDTVLLSPGCSSYDMFESYVQRGDEFKQLILRRKT